MNKKINPRTSNPVWMFFTSVKLTVVVLLLIAATSVIGTLIPQNDLPAFYVYKYGETLYKVFMAIDIFDMYHSWWFLLLMGILGINITVCSIHRLQATWKIIFPKKVNYSPGRFQKSKNSHSFQVKADMTVLVAGFEKFLRKHMGAVVRRDNSGEVLLFTEKGRWTRMGVYVVHVSVLLLLAGGVIGGVWGYKGFVSIPEGETAHRVELRKGGGQVDPGFAIRCNTFSVSFYDTGAPDEYKSNITILEEGREVLTTEIKVNHPLRYKGISLYQSNYGTDSATGVKLTITGRDSGMSYQKTLNVGDTITLPEAGGSFTLERFSKGYDFRGHNLGESFVGRVKDKTGKESQIVVPVRFPTFDKMRGGRFVFQVDDFEKKYYTGLQVTKDPGVWCVYTGFILMIIGCWITFFMSHQSLCVQIKEDGSGAVEVQVFGIANKNNQGMKLKTAKFSAKMKEIVS